MGNKRQVEIDGVTYNIVSPYDKIDESKLSIIDRLGLAYCRLNSYEWDPLLGEKPPSANDSFYYGKMNAIRNLIGDENASRCWWKFNLGRTEDEWREWYYQRFSTEPDRQRGHGEESCSNKLQHLPSFIRSLFFKE